MVPLLPNRLFPTMNSPVLKLISALLAGQIRTLSSWRKELRSMAVGVTSFASLSLYPVQSTESEETVGAFIMGYVAIERAV